MNISILSSISSLAWRQRKVWREETWRNKERREESKVHSAVNQGGETDSNPDKLSVLRRSTPVGPGFKARSTPRSCVPLPLLFLSPSLSFSPSLFFLLSPSFNLPPFLLYLSLHLGHFMTTHAYTNTRIHVYTSRVTIARRASLRSSASFPAILLPLLLSLSRNYIVLARMIHHRLEISGQ